MTPLGLGPCRGLGSGGLIPGVPILVAPGPKRVRDLFTENGLTIDLAEVKKVVEGCDVFTIGFRLFPQRLLVDTRSQEGEGPLVAVVEPVATVEERFFWLGQKRPRFGPPQRFIFFVWPHSIAFLEQCDIVEAIHQRCRSEVRQVQEAVAQLKQLERQAVQDALRGRNCHTLWSRN